MDLSLVGPKQVELDASLFLGCPHLVELLQHDGVNPCGLLQPQREVYGDPQLSHHFQIVEGTLARTPRQHFLILLCPLFQILSDLAS